jgi:hypothetical protein
MAKNGNRKLKKNSATGIVPQALFKNLKILDLGNTLVVEIQIIYRVFSKLRGSL